jgi:hypothetical protein
MSASPLSITLATAWLASTLAAQGPSWQRSLEAALQAIKDKNRPMLVAVVMPGERGSDAVIDHYKDSGVRKIANQCTCLRIDVGTSRPSADEREVLQRYLGAAPREPIVVPHHVMVHPDGETILSSASYQMTAGQLEWFIADGIRLLDKTFEWPLGERARAPESLRYGDVKKTETDTDAPPTKKEVKEAIAKLKKGGTGWQGSIEHYNTLLRSEDPSAIKYVQSQLSGRTGGFIAGTALSTIAEVSPTAWSVVLIDFLDNRNEARRKDAARGLAKMAYPKTFKAIKKRLKAEKEAEVFAWLLRAAAATAPKNKATITAIEKALAKNKDENVRMHAAVAASALEDKAASFRLMRKALADDHPDVRSAAAYAMATRRDAEMAAALEPAVQGERDAEAKHWLELALETLHKKRDLREFENFRTKVLGETRGGNRGGGNRGGGNRGGGNRGGGDRGGIQDPIN